jgi:hypothetical protein
LPQGLNVGYHPLLAAHDGLAAAFLQSNRPVIHILNFATSTERSCFSSYAYKCFPR